MYDDWWEQHLNNYKLEGQMDAENGVFEPPHPSDEDPQDEDENIAYKSGFLARRKELGDKFRWE